MVAVINQKVFGPWQSSFKRFKIAEISQQTNDAFNESELWNLFMWNIDKWKILIGIEW